MSEIIPDIRNPCNCGSAQVPRQYQNEGTGDDHIECRDCGDEVTTLGYDECIDAWNAANTDYTWEDIIANGGPIESAWTPLDLASGILWWDATDPDNYTESAGLVSAVTDKFGNGHDVAQPTGSLQPSTSGIINSVGCFNFPGVNIEHLAKATAIAALDANGDLLCTVVFKPSDTAARRYATYNDSLFRVSNDGLQDRAHNHDILTLTRGTAATIISTRMNDTENELWQDSAAETPATFSDEAAASTTSIVLGSNNGSARMIGDWAECVWYRDPNERAALEAYFADKYGITV